jgi:hypothetical protein
MRDEIRLLTAFLEHASCARPVASSCKRSFLLGECKET